MSIVKDIAGGYMLSLFISLFSVIFLLGACMVVSMIRPDANVITLFILAFNGTLGLFIVISAIPVAIFIIVFGFIYNAVAPTMQPLIENLLKMIVPVVNFIFGGAGITVTPFAPSSITFVDAMNAWTGFVTALGQYLLDATDLPGLQESTAAALISLVSRHL